MPTALFGIADNLTQPSTVNAGKLILELFANRIALEPVDPLILGIVATPTPFVVGLEFDVALYGPVIDPVTVAFSELPPTPEFSSDVIVAVSWKRHQTTGESAATAVA